MTRVRKGRQLALKVVVGKLASELRAGQRVSWLECDLFFFFLLLRSPAGIARNGKGKRPSFATNVFSDLVWGSRAVLQKSFSCPCAEKLWFADRDAVGPGPAIAFGPILLSRVETHSEIGNQKELGLGSWPGFTSSQTSRVPSARQLSLQHPRLVTAHLFRCRLNTPAIIGRRAHAGEISWPDAQRRAISSVTSDSQSKVDEKGHRPWRTLQSLCSLGAA